MNSPMEKKSRFERVIVWASFLLVALLLSGNDGCQQFFQEDVDVARQSNVKSTETPDDDDDDGTITRTPTSTPTGDASATATATRTSTATATAAATTGTIVEGGVGSEDPQSFALLKELSRLEDSSAASEAADLVARQTAAANDAKPSNWLGRSYLGDDTGQDFKDTDRDGFADWLEGEERSDANDIGSVPQLALKHRIGDRLHGVDDDADGVTNAQEIKLNLGLAAPDSDGDSILDGIEVLGATDPLDPASKPVDTDRDGVGDDLETQMGSSPYRSDSDADGLRDDLEVTLGANPISPDSDGDGISDGKEFQLGGDPIRSDRPPN